MYTLTLGGGRKGGRSTLQGINVKACISRSRSTLSLSRQRCETQAIGISYGQCEQGIPTFVLRFGWLARCGISVRAIQKTDMNQIAFNIDRILGSVPILLGH